MQDKTDNTALIDSVKYMQSRFRDEIRVDPDQAAQTANDILAASERAGFAKGMADAHADLGAVHLLQSGYADAVTEYLDALTIYDSLHIDSSSALCNYNLAVIYLTEGNADGALKFVQQAGATHHSLNMQAAEFADHYLTGNIDMSLQHYAVAREEYSSALTIGRALNDSLKVARALSGMGAAFTADGQADKGLEFHQAALKAWQSAPATAFDSEEARNFPSQLMLDMAGEYFLNNDYAQAIKSAQEGLSLAQSSGSREQQCIAYQKLGDLYGLTGREDIQLQYGEKYNKLHDSLTQEQSMKNIARMEVQYNTVKIQLLQSQQQSEEEKAELQKELADSNMLLRYAEITIAVIVVVFGGLLVYFRKH